MLNGEERLIHEGFLHSIARARSEAGFPGDIPRENLVVFFAINVTDCVFQQRMGVDDPERIADAIQFAAIAVIAARAASWGIWAAGVTDAAEKARIIDTCIHRSLGADVDCLSPDGHAQAALARSIYDHAKENNPDLIERINMKLQECTEAVRISSNLQTLVSGLPEMMQELEAIVRQ